MVTFLVTSNINISSEILVYAYTHQPEWRLRCSTTLQWCFIISLCASRCHIHLTGWSLSKIECRHRSFSWFRFICGKLVHIDLRRLTVIWLLLQRIGVVSCTLSFVSNLFAIRCLRISAACFCACCLLWRAYILLLVLFWIVFNIFARFFGLLALCSYFLSSNFHLLFRLVCFLSWFVWDLFGFFNILFNFLKQTGST